MANNIDRECCEILAEKFYKNAGFALGKGNGYEQTILEPRFEMLAEKLTDDPSVADVVVTDEEVATKEGAVVVHSYDVEKITAYMNTR